MSTTSDEQATSSNTVTIMVGSYLDMSQMISSGVVPSLVASGDIGLDALDYDMANVTYNGTYDSNLVTQLAKAWSESGSGTQEMSEYSGISSGAIELTNTTNATINVSAQGALLYATDGKAYETEEAPTNAAWSNGTSQTGGGYYVIKAGETITVPIEATFQGDDAASDAAGSITTSSVAGLTVTQTSALSAGSSYTNPEDNTQSGWLTTNFGNYTFVFTDQGLSPAEAHVNVNASISWTATDVASWDGYVDNARSVGILNLALLESDAVPNEDPTQAFATSAFYAGIRSAALYSGGVEIEQPSYYWFADSASEQMTVIEEIRWANANGLRSSLLIDDQINSAGDPDPNFVADTVKMLDQLQAEGALPSQIVFENDNSTDSGSYDYDAATSDITSLNAVALTLASDFKFTPSASEDELEVKGTSTAQTTLIMTGVEPSEDVASGSFTPYSETLIASENTAKTLTLTVTDTTGKLALSDSLNDASASAGGALTFTGTAAQATTFLNDLTASAATGTVDVANLELTLTDYLGDTTEGVTSVYLGDVHPTFTAITETSSATGTLIAGDKVTFTVATSAAVSVTGSPLLLLTNEEYATYTGQDSRGDLLFSYTLTSSDDAETLRVRGLRLDGASITNSSTGLAINPDSINAPEEAMAGLAAVTSKTDTITSVTETAASSSALVTGSKVTFLFGASNAITTVSGKPTLTLNNGGTATYAGLSNSGQMEFTYTIPTDLVSSKLAPTTLNLNSAAVTDSAGLAVTAPSTVPTPATTLSFNTIDTIAAVTETGSASKLVKGSVITFLLTAESPISSVSGTPILSLSNANTTTYAGLTSAGQLKFTFVVPSGSVVHDVTATALVLNGSVVIDDLGATVIASSSLPRSATELSYNTIVKSAGTASTTTATSTTATSSMTVTMVDGVPISVASDQAIGAPTALSGQAGIFSVGSELGIADPSGNAEALAHLYKAVLDRAPDAAGLQNWVGLVDSGSMPITTAATDLVESAEFASKFDSLTNAQFVNVLAENTTGSAATAADQNYVSALNAGTSRGTVAMQFAESASNVVNMLGTSGDTNYGEIYRIYETTLGRAPDSTGLPGYLDQLENGASLQGIVNNFINSQEYVNDYGTISNTQFVTELYKDGLGRAPDAAGLQTWVNDLNNGTSRASVVLAISDSSEARVVTASATHDNWLFLGS